MTDTVNDAATNAVTAPATDIEFLSAYDQGFARVAAVTRTWDGARITRSGAVCATGTSTSTPR